MTREDKQLLLKDLSARLPYGVICQLSSGDTSITEKLGIGGLSDFMNGSMKIKPYLRTMSSMTGEERQFLLKFGTIGMDENDKVFVVYPFGLGKTMPVIDFLNAHHFDYRGLIERGLALEAPEDMYKSK